MFHPISKYLTFLLITLCLIGTINSAVVGASGESCCDDNVINVNGFGKVSVQPDIAIVSVGASKTAKTSQQATQKVAEQINQILSILKKNNIETEDIKTESISIFPQYEYPNGAVQLVGQTAQQYITVTIRKIDQNGGNLGSIIDKLVSVDGIQFNGLKFDKENKSEAQKLARKLAFEDAKKKALEYAGLSDRSLGKVLTINDNSQSDPIPIAFNAEAFAMKSSVGSSVPVGDQQITYSVNVKYALI